jgi:hypothetical protein
LLAFVLACSESPTAPTAVSAPAENPQAGLLDDLFGAADELLFCPTTETLSASETIGPAGGTIAIGPHELRVPAGALSAPVTITATAPAGDHVRVEFQPHGLWFITRPSLRMSYAHCGLLTRLTGKIVYVDDDLQIQEQVTSINDILGQQVTGRIRHFSSYALAF